MPRKPILHFPNRKRLQLPTHLNYAFPFSLCPQCLGIHSLIHFPTQVGVPVLRSATRELVHPFPLGRNRGESPRRRMIPSILFHGEFTIVALQKHRCQNFRFWAEMPLFENHSALPLYSYNVRLFCIFFIDRAMFLCVMFCVFCLFGI